VGVFVAVVGVALGGGGAVVGVFGVVGAVAVALGVALSSSELK
jgi:hypothetical protein